MSEQNEQRERLAEDSAGYSGELVTVGVFPDPATANVARMALESAGIAAFLQGENANNLIPVAFSAQLQVRAEDEAAARTVLEQAEVAPESMESVTAAEKAAENGTP